MFTVLIALSLSITASAQSASDSSYQNKIEILESKINSAKKNISKDDKKEMAAVSDIENRKNNLKSQLKTAAGKRSGNFNEEWNSKYSALLEKVDHLKSK